MCGFEVLRNMLRSCPVAKWINDPKVRRDLAVMGTEAKVWLGLRVGDERGFGWGRMLHPNPRHFPICLL